MNLRQLNLLILIYFTSLISEARHVVFDLDWTLFYITNTKSYQYDQTHVFQYDGIYYRLSHGAIELIEQLYLQDFQISIFSGGEKARNQFLAAQLTKLIQRKHRQFQFYKILDFHHLTLKNPLPGIKFADKWAKDLRKIHHDLSQVVLVDDMIQLALPEQQKNVIHLEKTYNDFPKYELIPLVHRDQYDPPSEVEWYMERQKLYVVRDRLMALQQHLPFPEQLPTILQKEVCRFVLLKSSSLDNY